MFTKWTKNKTTSMTSESGMAQDMGERKPYVIINGEQCALDDVEFIDVEEDISGRDVYTVRKEGTTYRSFVTLQ